MAGKRACKLRMRPRACAGAGDQPFWGEACRRSGVGPAPVDIDSLTAERLADGLRTLAQPQARPSPHLIVYRLGMGCKRLLSSTACVHKHEQPAASVLAVSWPVQSHALWRRSAAAPQVRAAAARMSERMRAEPDGAQAAADNILWCARGPMPGSRSSLQAADHLRH